MSGLNLKNDMLRIQINILSSICPTNAEFSPGSELNPGVGKPTNCFFLFVDLKDASFIDQDETQPSIKIRTFGCTEHW